MTAPADPTAVPRPVPPGPGVQPPFAAAPIEGRRARRWLAAAVAAAVVVVCCGLGVVGVGGLVVTMIPALNEQAERAVGDYLDALVAEDWDQAYDLSCGAVHEEQSRAEFTRRISRGPQLESYELGQLDLLDTQGDQMFLPVDLTYADGTTERETVPLAQDRQTGTLRVCQRAG